MRKPNILVFDLETTGLDPKRHEIIEIGAILVDTGLNEISRWCAKVRPEHIETASARALELNGYTPEGWAGAISQEEAKRFFVFMAHNTIPCGHNVVAFDLGFIRQWIVPMQHRMDEDTIRDSLPWHDFHAIDTQAFSGVLRSLGQSPVVSLMPTVEALGGPARAKGATHRALEDAEASLWLFRWMRDHTTRSILTGERVTWSEGEAKPEEEAKPATSVGLKMISEKSACLRRELVCDTTTRTNRNYYENLAVQTAALVLHGVGGVDLYDRWKRCPDVPGSCDIFNLIAQYGTRSRSEILALAGALIVAEIDRIHEKGRY